MFFNDHHLLWVLPMVSFFLEIEPIVFSWANSFLEQILHFPVSIAQLDKASKLQARQGGVEENLMKLDMSF